MLQGVTMQEIKRRAAQGHRSWVFWTDRAGVNHAARYGFDAIKAAIYAVGCRGRWYCIGADGNSMVIRTLTIGNTMLRNARRGY